MKNELQIIVSGEANSGKSTMMFALLKILKEQGFNVQLNFENDPDLTREKAFHFHNKFKERFEEVLEDIKANSKITLKEVQTARLPKLRHEI